MRTKLAMLATALLLTVTADARAQGAPRGEAPMVGSVDFGGRLFDVDGDQARVQRYRDLRGGGFLENFRYQRDTDTWLFEAKATHVGYRDQQYEATVNRFGRVKAWFEWNQIPLFYSTDSRTPYTAASAGEIGRAHV